MLKINKLKKIKSNFPVIVGEQIISKKVCNSLIKEISKHKQQQLVVVVIGDGAGPRLEELMRWKPFLTDTPSHILLLAT